MTREAGAPGAVDNGRGRARTVLVKVYLVSDNLGWNLYSEGHLPGGNGNLFDLAKRADVFVLRRLAVVFKSLQGCSDSVKHTEIQCIYLSWHVPEDPMTQPLPWYAFIPQISPVPGCLLSLSLD